MKITMLIENTACKEHSDRARAISGSLACEHGLSLYIEARRHRILFDTGQTGAFADNAAKMGVDLAKVDIAVLSHGHYDHGGGLSRFFAENDSARVYINENAFRSCWHGEKYIGLDPHLQGNARFIVTGDECRIDDELLLRTCRGMEMRHPLSGEGLTVLENGAHVQDDFRHEQYLSIFEDGKHVLLSGCSHRGVLNIVRALKSDVLVGGFHFKKMDPDGSGRERLLLAAGELLEYPARYYTCHCTGEEQYALMKTVMGDRLSYFSGGMTIDV